MNFATLARPRMGASAARTAPPPSDVDTASAPRSFSRADNSPCWAAVRNARSRRSCSAFVARAVRSPAMCLRARGHDLAHVTLGHVEHRTDLTVGVLEGLAQHIGGPLGWSQLLKQQEDGEFESLATLCSKCRVGAGIDRLRDPGPDVCLAPRVRRPERC